MLVKYGIEDFRKRYEAILKNAANEAVDTKVLNKNISKLLEQIEQHKEKIPIEHTKTISMIISDLNKIAGKKKSKTKKIKITKMNTIEKSPTPIDKTASQSSKVENTTSQSSNFRERLRARMIAAKEEIKGLKDRAKARAQWQTQKEVISIRTIERSMEFLSKATGIEVPFPKMNFIYGKQQHETEILERNKVAYAFYSPTKKEITLNFFKSELRTQEQSFLWNIIGHEFFHYAYDLTMDKNTSRARTFSLGSREEHIHETSIDEGASQFFGSVIEYKIKHPNETLNSADAIRSIIIGTPSGKEKSILNTLKFAKGLYKQLREADQKEIDILTRSSFRDNPNVPLTKEGDVQKIFGVQDYHTNYDTRGPAIAMLVYAKNNFDLNKTISELVRSPNVDIISSIRNMKPEEVARLDQLLVPYMKKRANQKANFIRKAVLYTATGLSSIGGTYIASQKYYDTQVKALATESLDANYKSESTKMGIKYESVARKGFKLLKDSGKSDIEIPLENGNIAIVSKNDHFEKSTVPEDEKGKPWAKNFMKFLDDMEKAHGSITNMNILIFDSPGALKESTSLQKKLAYELSGSAEEISRKQQEAEAAQKRMYELVKYSHSYLLDKSGNILHYAERTDLQQQ
jgi:hypothetical protein